MKPLFILLILASGSLRSVGEEAKLWSGNKLTPEQPFPARVRAVRTGWEGCFLLLEEVGGSQGRLCIAEVRVLQAIDYGVIKDIQAEEKSEGQRKVEGWTYLSPAIEVTRFSWSSGAYTLGDRFGEEDILTKTDKYLKNKRRKAEQAEAPSLPVAAVEKIAPPLAKAPVVEVEKALAAFEKGDGGDLAIIRRGLICDQTYFRARCAQILGRKGGIDDVPYLIDALSDESLHDGVEYPVAGMATTRYWANVALIAICKTSYDYRWDARPADREYAISQWKQHWDRIKPKKG